MNKTKEVIKIWRNIFGKKEYFLLVPVVAVFFYIFNALISNIGNLLYVYRQSGFSEGLVFAFTIIMRFAKTILPSSVVTIIIIGVFTGILISLLIYRFAKLRMGFGSKVGFFASIGLFLGIFAPGCAACGIGIAGVIGLGTSLAILPFQGRELGFLAIGILSILIIKISSELATPSECQIDGEILNVHTVERR